MCIYIYIQLRVYIHGLMMFLLPAFLLPFVQILKNIEDTQLLLLFSISKTRPEAPSDGG